MSDARQVWLIAQRELRERSRSRAFRASLVVMVVAVVAMVVLPTVLLSSTRDRDIGFAGDTPTGLAVSTRTQAAAAGLSAHLHAYPTRTVGDDAVREGDVDVLVVDGTTLHWPRRADDKLKAVMTGAIQLVAVRDRAAVAGIGTDDLRALMAPVAVTNIELSKVAGRSADDETATTVMIGLLLLAISVYGGLVLGGVVEEKSTRVVEVLLARVPARTLLAGKVIGIGLLGLAQVAVTAVAALIAIAAVDSLDVPAMRAAVLGWALVWFVLGYALYATLYGALGALASRPEDAQSVAGPAMMVMVVSYFAAFTMIAQADSALSRAISYFPTTAPLAMPSRIAMGAASWWEPFVATAVTVAATVGLVRIGGQLYASAILHGGPTLSLHDAWRASRDAPVPARRLPQPRRRPRWTHPLSTGPAGRTRASSNVARPREITLLTVTGVALGGVVAATTRDVILAVMVGAGFVALTVQTWRAWTGRRRR
jgi:ABC-2 type transport system permease protein